ncbi:hypothetical protein ABIB85_008218 [Bradyrhizobium sp. JR1.5]|uniref:hypothetical protein n=1 Tax=unclassified Bradyrhizobium TaxID=2631580 RepID=UPI0033911BC4
MKTYDYAFYVARSDVAVKYPQHDWNARRNGVYDRGCGRKRKIDRAGLDCLHHRKRCREARLPDNLGAELLLEIAATHAGPQRGPDASAAVSDHSDGQLRRHRIGSIRAR